uniref:Uncharacterized protein n=1 Tax=Strongyloides stercoralis TaxID=6248 RepID=A0A0K0EQC9_STRER
MLIITILNLLFFITIIKSNESINDKKSLQEKKLFDHIEEMKEFKLRRKRNCCATCPPGRDCGCGDCHSFHNHQCRQECMPACERFCIQAYEVQTVYDLQPQRVCADQCMPKCEPMCTNRINVVIPQPKCHDLCMPTCAPSCINRLVIEIPQPKCQDSCMPSCSPSCTQQIIIPVPQRKCVDPCMPLCLPTCTSQDIIITQPSPVPSCGIPQCPTCAPDCVSKYNVQVVVPQQRKCHDACLPSCHSKCVEAMAVLDIQVKTPQKRCPEACLPSCNSRCIEAVSMLEVRVSQPSCGIPECPSCERSCVEKYRPQQGCHFACRPLCTPQCVQFVQQMEVKITPSCGIRECPTCEPSCVEKYRTQISIPTQNCVSYCQPQCAPQCVQAFAHIEVSSMNNNNGTPRKLKCTSVPCTCPVGYIQCSQSDCCLMYFNMAKKYSKKARKEQVQSNNIENDYSLKESNFQNGYMKDDRNIKKKKSNTKSLTNSKEKRD